MKRCLPFKSTLALIKIIAFIFTLFSLNTKIQPEYVASIYRGQPLANSNIIEPQTMLLFGIGLIALSKLLKKPIIKHKNGDLVTISMFLLYLFFLNLL